MKYAGRPLDALISGLRGQAPAADWPAVLALANRTLLTPPLYSSLAASGQIHRLPEDVHEYLRFIHGRNRERNRRLRAQLNEAVAALNRRGIVPLLLKGAVPLFICRSDRLPNRITSDLDLAVEASEEAAAHACLAELGYRPLAGGRGMSRAQDAGILELRPKRMDDREPPRLVRRLDCRAKVPAVESLALHWIMHDLLKEGDYRRGTIDLRHLYDLAELDKHEGVDWAALRLALSDRRARNALDTQLLTLHHLFGTAIPAECADSLIVRFQHWRRIFPAMHPLTGAPVRLAGNVAWGTWRLSLRGAFKRRGPLAMLHRIAWALLGGDVRTKI